VNKLIIFILFISLDIISKKIIFNYVDLFSSIKIFPFLDIIHIHNFGVSFGLFSGFVSPWLLILLGLLVVFFIYYLMISSKDSLERWGLFVIISEL